MPGFKIPENVIAVPNLREAAKDASILIFVIPHQFLPAALAQLQSAKLADGCRAVSLIKGLCEDASKCEPVSRVISNALGGMEVSVLMGANIANEVAREQFCESTLGVRSKEGALLLCKLFNDQRSFRVSPVEDVYGVELCGALKNVVALAAGFVDGLLESGCSDNAKAAVVRIGLGEMRRFISILHPETKAETIFESCGIADLLTTCYGGRNRRIAQEHAACGGARSIEELERDLLNGQRLQGPSTAAHVYRKLKQLNQAEEFPLFSVVHRICAGEESVRNFFGLL